MTDTSFPAILARWPSSLFVGVVLLAGCQPLAPREAPALAHKPAATEFAPLPPPPPLPVEGSTHFVVAGAKSDVRILVARGGPLAKVGHSHAVRARELSGDIYLAPEFHRSGFALTFPVLALHVDPADARNDEGEEFAVIPSPQAIDATFKNMIGPEVLDAKQFPEITLRSVALTGPTWGPEATVRVTLHGVERHLIVPLAVHSEGEEIIITGLMQVRTSDFGMTPFSVLGGGLKVLDEVKIRFRIVALRTTE